MARQYLVMNNSCELVRVEGEPAPFVMNYCAGIKEVGGRVLKANRELKWPAPDKEQLVPLGHPILDDYKRVVGYSTTQGINTA